MHGLLRDLHQRHLPTVLLVTDDVNEAIELADRVLVLVLDRGRIAVDRQVELPAPRSHRDPGPSCRRSRPGTSTSLRAGRPASYSASRAAPKVRLLGAVQDGNVGGSSILVKNSSNIRTLADLKRRKVAPGSNLRWSVVPCQTVLLGPYAFAAFPVARCQGHHRARRHPLIVLVRSTAGSCTRRIRS
jgi:energy-coupling factor transporter ATP-binding protein EcfA2